MKVVSKWPHPQASTACKSQVMRYPNLLPSKHRMVVYQLPSVYGLRNFGSIVSGRRSEWWDGNESAVLSTGAFARLWITSQAIKSPWNRRLFLYIQCFHNSHFWWSRWSTWSKCWATCCFLRIHPFQNADMFMGRCQIPSHVLAGGLGGCRSVEPKRPWFLADS